MRKENMMFRFEKGFQIDLFNRVIKKYNGSIKASSFLKIPPSSIRGYKNIYFDSVPEKLINTLIELKITNSKEIKDNTLTKFVKEEQIATILDKGREKRREFLSELKRKLPAAGCIIKNGRINVADWLKYYKTLLELNLRKVEINEENYFLKIRYRNFAKTEYKYFEVNLPKKIKIDKEFSYFFGLWCGDRAGGKRFGIVNKNPEIINFTEYFLKKNRQEIEKILYIQKDLASPKIPYNKRVNHLTRNGWALSVHSKNGIFASFFIYLKSYLPDLLYNLDLYAFFAGLFDAEGNVSLYNKSFRWACKDNALVSIYSEFLKKLNLFDKYDGGSLVSYNKVKFYNKILPYLKHKNKINDTKFLCKGEGTLPKDYLLILKEVKNLPLRNAQEIAKALKKTKVYSELKLLNDFGCISRVDYPYRYKVTERGTEIVRSKKL